MIAADLVAGTVHVWSVTLGDRLSAEVFIGVFASAWVDDTMRGSVDVAAIVKIAFKGFGDGGVALERIVGIAICVVVELVDIVHESDSDTAIQKIAVLEASQESVGVGRRALRTYE